MAFQPIISCYSYRYGQRGNDGSVISQYIVTAADAEVNAYQVVHANKDDAVYDGDTLPEIWEGHPETPFYRIYPGGIVAQRMAANSTKWIVTVTYRASTMLIDNIYNFRIGTRAYREVAQGAYSKVYPNAGELTLNVPDDPTDNRITFVNSVGELYDPADTQVDYYTTLLQFVKREEREFSYVDTMKYINTLNSKDMVIFGFPILKNQAIIRSIIPELKPDEEGEPQWHTMYEIEIMPEGRTWRLKLQNQGYSANFGGTEREITLKDINPATKASENKPVTKPQLLAEDGSLLADKEKANFFEYRVHIEADWETALGIPADALDLSTTGNFLEGQR